MPPAPAELIAGTAAGRAGVAPLLPETLEGAAAATVGGTADENCGTDWDAWSTLEYVPGVLTVLAELAMGIAELLALVLVLLLLLCL